MNGGLRKNSSVNTLQYIDCTTKEVIKAVEL